VLQNLKRTHDVEGLGMAKCELFNAARLHAQPLLAGDVGGVGIQFEPHRASPWILAHQPFEERPCPTSNLQDISAVTDVLGSDVELPSISQVVAREDPKRLIQASGPTESGGIEL
jgi:hypothetical protein